MTVHHSQVIKESYPTHLQEDESEELLRRRLFVSANRCSQPTASGGLGIGEQPLDTVELINRRNIWQQVVERRTNVWGGPLTSFETFSLMTAIVRSKQNWSQNESSFAFPKSPTCPLSHMVNRLWRCKPGYATEYPKGCRTHAGYVDGWAIKKAYPILWNSYPQAK